jgi:hypothetical protein
MSVQTEIMEERLKGLLSNVTEWLKFAEAKLATAVAINGAIIFGAAQVLSSAENISVCLKFYLIEVIGFAAVALVISVIGLLPRTSIPRSIHREPTLRADNLVFYGHIIKYKPHEYIEALAASCGTSEYRGTQFERGYAEQIITLSIIADEKYRFFKWGAYLSLSAILTPVGALGVFFWRHSPASTDRSLDTPPATQA